MVQMVPWKLYSGEHGKAVDPSLLEVENLLCLMIDDFTGFALGAKSGSKRRLSASVFLFESFEEMVEKFLERWLEGKEHTNCWGFGLSW